MLLLYKSIVINCGGNTRQRVTYGTAYHTPMALYQHILWGTKDSTRHLHGKNYGFADRNGDLCLKEDTAG